jgi:hypothetical protein
VFHELSDLCIRFSQASRVSQSESLCQAIKNFWLVCRDQVASRVCFEFRVEKQLKSATFADEHFCETKLKFSKNSKKFLEKAKKMWVKDSEIENKTF